MDPEDIRRSAQSQLFDGAPDPVFVVDPAGVFLDLNPAAARYLGASREALLGRSLRELFSADQAQRQLEVLREVSETGKPFIQERVTSIGNDTYIFQYTVQKLDDLEGRCLGLLGMVRDVTGLVALERRYAELYEKATDALFAVDRDGRVRTLNRQAELLSGYSRELVESLHFSEVVAADELDRVRRNFEARLAGRDAPTEYELRYRHASGEERWAEIHISREESASGGFQASVRDTSARKRLEALRRDFLHVVTHDMKAPLTVIQGFASGLASELYGPVTEEQATGLQAILEATHRLRHLTEQFLLAERLDAEENLPWSASPVCEILEQAAESVRGEADTKRISLELDTDGAHELLVPDREGLRCVAENFLSNALKFTLPGGRIQVRARPEGHSVRVEVEDTGRGIPQEDLGKIFDRFYRGATAGGTWGTGLGLYIVRRTVERMGGRVTADSRPGEGSRFTAWVPAADRGGAEGR